MDKVPLKLCEVTIHQVPNKRMSSILKFQYYQNRSRLHFNYFMTFDKLNTLVVYILYILVYNIYK